MVATKNEPILNQKLHHASPGQFILGRNYSLTVLFFFVLKRNNPEYLLKSNLWLCEWGSKLLHRVFLPLLLLLASGITQHFLPLDLTVSARLLFIWLTFHSFSASSLLILIIFHHLCLLVCLFWLKWFYCAPRLLSGFLSLFVFSLFVKACLCWY